MTASAMLLIAAVAMVSCAKRIKLKPESEDVIHPMAAPMVHEVPMTNTPVVNVQRLHAPSSIFPDSGSNSTGMLFPALAGMRTNISDSRANYETVLPYSSQEPSSSESGRKVVDTAINNVMNDVINGREVIKDVTNTASSPNTVESLKLDFFKGTWFQMYGSSSSSNLAFGNAALSSTYTPSKKGDIITVETEGVGPGGLPTEITGTIKASGTASPGQRKLSFDKFFEGYAKVDMVAVDRPGFEGDYWIYKLGPVVDKKYEYAIVGEAMDPEGPAKTEHAVIARSPKGFKSKYEDEVQDWLIQNGFNSARKPPRASLGKMRPMM